MAYAHSRNNLGQRHDLVAHLRGVASLASQFASEFGAAEVAHYLGLWHDLGKFNPAFERYLLACEADPAARGHGPDHKAAGAQLAIKHLQIAALLVQGHHGGLRSPTDLQTWLNERAVDQAVKEALANARRALPDLEPAGELPFPSQTRHDAAAAELFLRLLFSALVDADFLDTERHFQSESAAQRGSTVSIAELWERFERDQQRVSGLRNDTVGRVRHEVYQACLTATERPPGIFRLTVPTGGGKTRSGMAFALRHALRYGHRRVIVAVPFITITEQTAEVYRAIFGADDEERPVVLEHHSGARRIAAADDDFHSGEVWTRLAAENWDAPIIVTTTVQLFESLFGNGTSGSRKLHRLARSVIILDEAQALPSYLLDPILDVLRQLSTHYGTTVVISTATQPAFEAIRPFASVPAQEIVAEPTPLFAALKRVKYEWREDHPLSWQEVADLMRNEPQALAIVNTKKDAIALLDALADPEALHLSTLLCGAHRLSVIAEVRRRLKAGEPCLLVSTQVVEAGVDLDFPMVLRALGPLDGIIQAAGRCNREGQLPYGRVVVFRPTDGGMPPGPYQIGAGVTAALLRTGTLDPDDPAAPREYFRRLFQTVSTDSKGIQDLRARFDYPEVARRFQMIDDSSSIVVAYGRPAERAAVQRRLEQLRRGTPAARPILRLLQPYLVSIRSREVDRYRKQGLIAQVLPDLGEWLGAYDQVRGLAPHDPDPDVLVV